MVDYSSLMDGLHCLSSRLCNWCSNRCCCHCERRYVANITDNDQYGTLRIVFSVVFLFCLFIVGFSLPVLIYEKSYEKYPMNFAVFYSILGIALIASGIVMVTQIYRDCCPSQEELAIHEASEDDIV